MTSFVILAAGYGSRIGRAGEHLHKALVPLGGKAILSHLLDRCPPWADPIVCTGYRSEQIEEYLRLAHPSRQVTIITVPGWNEEGGGPGWSLLQAKPHVTGDMIFTSCDTLWAPDSVDFTSPASWLGVAPIPVGTPDNRWCRVLPGVDKAEMIADKISTWPGGMAWTGMGNISEHDLEQFWRDLQFTSSNDIVGGELQMSAGFMGLAGAGLLYTQQIDWTDVGDAEAYRRAVIRWDGYDWSKTAEATYVISDESRVVKYFADQRAARQFRFRAGAIPGSPELFPDGQPLTPHFIPMEYISTRRRVWNAAQMIDWCEANLWTPSEPSQEQVGATARFYRDKALERLQMLSDDLYERVAEALHRLPTDISEGVVPSPIHGDLTWANVLWRGDITPALIDWRPDFAGSTTWGDLRYDLAKLLTCSWVDWDAARHGDFRPPLDAQVDEVDILSYAAHKGYRDVGVLAALCLLGSAPLHPVPFDEILVERGIANLDRFLGDPA